MPSYELALVLKKMAHPQTAAVLKRVAVKIMDNKGILFEIMNLGSRKTPFKMTAHGQKFTEARYTCHQLSCLWKLYYYIFFFNNAFAYKYLFGHLGNVFFLFQSATLS